MRPVLYTAFYSLEKSWRKLLIELFNCKATVMNCGKNTTELVSDQVYCRPNTHHTLSLSNSFVPSPISSS
jgi:hypothetical protein